MKSEADKRRSWRGIKLCAGIVLVGGAFLLGLYALRPAASPHAPENVIVGIPNGAVRVVSMHVEGKSVDVILDELKRSSPDVVMLQHVEARNVPAIVGAMGMAEAHHPANYQPTQNLGEKKSAYGTLLMSRAPLYDARAIRSADAGFGVMASCVMNGRKFVVASVEFASDPTIREREQQSLGQALGKSPRILGLRDAVEPSEGWGIREASKNGAVRMTLGGR